MGFVFVPYGVSYGTLNYHFIELLFWLYNSIYKFTGPIMGFFLFHMGLAMGPVNTHFSCTHYGTFDRLWWCCCWFGFGLVALAHLLLQWPWTLSSLILRLAEIMRVAVTFLCVLERERRADCWLSLGQGFGPTLDAGDCNLAFASFATSTQLQLQQIMTILAPSTATNNDNIGASSAYYGAVHHALPAAPTAPRRPDPMH